MKYDLEKQDLLNICKTASYDELNDLSSDIRDFLIEKVSRTGGHLASNLGVVELSIALMRVFNTPHDKIIYDVGHQSYVHKILTGRASGFDSLRQFKGMSGFPKSRESEHDAYDTGHSSTSISAAYGMAVARDLAKDDYNVVAVIGDGSFTGGVVFEAFNNIGENQTNMNIVLNDNGMSISRNVGSLSKYLTKLRTSEKYDQAKLSLKSALKNVPVIGAPLESGLKTSKEKLRYALIGEEGHIIEDFGIKYFGPVDGYNIEELSEVLTAAAKYQGPTLIHVITTKGRGYDLAEKNPSRFHGIGSFDIETGELIAKSSEETYSSAFGRKILELADFNKKIVGITAAMGEATGLGEFSRKFPKRYFDVGIAEEHASLFAAGLAKSGFTPIVAIYSSFLQRAFDFIIQDIALQKLHVVFAIDRAGLVGADGETHHGVFDLSYMSMIPNMTVLAPADGKQLEEMLDYAVNKLDGPVAIRYPRGSCAGNHRDLPEFNGSCNEICNGEDITIYAVGNMLDTAIQSADILTEAGYSVGIVNVSVVKPLNTEIGNVSSKLCVTLEDNVIRGGFGEEFNAAFVNYDYDIINIGIPDVFIEHGSVSQLQNECGIDAESIARKVMEHIERKA